MWVTHRPRSWQLSPKLGGFREEVSVPFQAPRVWAEPLCPPGWSGWSWLGSSPSERLAGGRGARWCGQAWGGSTRWLRLWSDSPRRVVAAGREPEGGGRGVQTRVRAPPCTGVCWCPTGPC